MPSHQIYKENLGAGLLLRPHQQICLICQVLKGVGKGDTAVE